MGEKSQHPGRVCSIKLTISVYTQENFFVNLFELTKP